MLSKFLNKIDGTKTAIGFVTLAASQIIPADQVNIAAMEIEKIVEATGIIVGSIGVLHKMVKGFRS